MNLVSIIGKEDSSIFPILYEFKTKICTHIIVHDDSKHDKNRVKKIINAQNNFKEFYNLEYRLFIIQIDEDSLKDLENCTNKIIDISKNDFSNIYINVTDGLSSTALVLSRNLCDKGVNFLAYDIYDNGYNLLKKNKLEKKLLNFNNDIYSHFLLKGHKIVSMGNKIEAFKRKESILEICKDLEVFQSFLNEFLNKPFNEIKGFLNIKNNLIKIKKQKDRSFVQGTVFEEYIYWIISDNFDFDQVMFNVKVEFNSELFNEFDILMIKDNHLHTIECKLRKFVQGEGLIYKLDSLKDYIDDDGKAMLLVIGGENERITKHGNRKVQFSRGTNERANNLDIKIHHKKVFELSEFIKDVKEHFLTY